MVRYAVRAVPWFRVVLAASLVVLLMELVQWNIWRLWPLQGTAVGLLAGAAAWCFDEAAAVVVDATPRSLRWRTVARSPGVLVLASAWVTVVLHVGGSGGLFGHRDEVLVQGLVAIAAGTGYACWRRSLGEAQPGLLLATAIVPAATAWALVRPFESTLLVFPLGTNTSAEWSASALGWMSVGVAAAVLGLAALFDAPWWRVPARPAGRPHQ